MPGYDNVYNGGGPGSLQHSNAADPSCIGDRSSMACTKSAASKDLK